MMTLEEIAGKPIQIRCGSFWKKLLSMMMVAIPNTAPKFHPLKTPYPFSLSL